MRPAIVRRIDHRHRWSRRRLRRVGLDIDPTGVDRSAVVVHGTGRVGRGDSRRVLRGGIGDDGYGYAYDNEERRT